MKNYDMKSNSLILGGRIGTGFADGDDVVSFEMNEDAWALSMGADGEGTRSKSNNNSGRLTVKLAKESPFNAVLMGFYKADQLSNAGAVPMLFKDGSGNTLHSCEQMWITKIPTDAHGRAPGDMEWVLESDNLIMNPLGS